MTPIRASFIYKEEHQKMTIKSQYVVSREYREVVNKMQMILLKMNPNP